jgi:hypothetical protein
MCVWQIIAALLLLLLLSEGSQAYPIQVHDEVEYEAPAHDEQLLHYVPQVQYSHEPEGHEVEVHQNVSASRGQKSH